MTQAEVINKLSMEMAMALGDLETLQTCRTYIQMALSIGLEHFTKDSQEIICMNYSGEEIARFKSTREASLKLGVDRRNIDHVLRGCCQSAGGYKFMKAKDKELVPMKEAV